MKKSWTRLIALLLTLAMVTALLPAAAAEETTPEIPDVPGAATEAPDTPDAEPPAVLPEDGGQAEAEPPVDPPEDGDQAETEPPAGFPEDGNQAETEPPAGFPEDGDQAETEPPAGFPEDGNQAETEPPVEFPEDAVLDIPGQVFAADGDVEYVLDTDGIDSGAVYAIYTNEAVNGDNRILYHTGTGKTDKVLGSVSDDKLTLNGDFSGSRQLWTITKVDGGYTIQSVDSGRYLDLSSDSTKNINTSDAPVVLLLTPQEENTYTISQENGFSLAYNAEDIGGQGKGNIYAGTEEALLRFFKQTSVAVEPEPEPEPESPVVPDRAEQGKREYGQVSGALESGYYAIRANGNTMYCTANKTTTDQCGASVSVSGGKLTMDGHPDCHVWLILKGQDGYTIQSMGGGGQYLSYGTAGQYNHLPVSEDAAVFQITPDGDAYTISWTSGSGETLYVSRGTTTEKEKWGTGTSSYPIELYQETAPEEPEAPEKPAAPDDLSVYIYPKASGEIEDGVYAIVGSTIEKNTARPRVMHCEASYTVTNQCQVVESDYVNGVLADQISMGCTLSHLWEVKAVEGGYTFQSLTGPYLNHGSAGYNHLPVGSAPAVFDINPLENGGYAITWTAGGTELNLGWNNKWGGSAAPYTIYLYKMTETEPAMAQTHFSGISYGQPLVKEDTGSSYFRIPALLTLDNGWILASSDIRWRTSADNPQNLDTIVSISRDGGETWAWEVVNYYADEAITTTSQASAAFIDPAFVQSGDGTVWMAVDATPSYVGLMGGNRRGSASRGFDSQGRMLVAHGQADADAPTDLAPYIYYVDLNAEGAAYEVGGKTAVLHPICASADDSETGYWVDAFLDLYYDYGGEGGMKPVLCAQRGSDKAVQNNLFYRQSQWKAYPAFFIMVRSAQVTDSGLEWGEPKYLDIKLSENESFLGVCPGRGTIAMVDGKERIIFPLYDNQTGNELASVAYSDDGGETWTRGSRANNLNGTGKSSESQIVRLPDGSLRMYSRNTINYLGYADSTDGGKTWGPYTRDMELYSQNPGNGCMVSFINVEGVLIAPDNTVYENLILASYPRLQRTTGTVRIGSIDADTHEVAWLNTDTQYIPAGGGSSFAYSCLTQLQNADGQPGDTFGLLYEYSPETSTIHYVPITLDELLGEGWSLLQALPVLPEVSLDQDLLDLNVGGTGILTAAISLPDIEVVWTSSDEAVATVDGGAITGVAAGRAVITATVTVGPLTRSASAEVVVQSDVITVPTKYTDAVSSQFFPSVTTYELEAGALESGAVYAVFDAAGGRRILYHAAGTTVTNQWQGSASNGLLNLSGAKTTAVLWTVEQTEDGGYTLCSLDDGKYLNYGTTGSHNQLPVTDTPQAFTIAPLEDGSFSISWGTASGTAYLDWSSWWGAGTEEYPLQFFQRVVTESHTVYTAHAENLRVLIGIAGADEADYADVLALAGPYNAEEAAQAAQAQIDAAALALYTAYRTPEPEPKPVYTLTYQITGRYFTNAAYAVQSYEEGAAVTPVAAPSHSGYNFSGWTGVPAHMPARNVTVTGSFTVVSTGGSSGGGGGSSGGGTTIPDPDVPRNEQPETEINDNQTPLASNPFIDVDAGKWYAKAVAFVQEKGLMQGTSSETFEPNTNLSRSMMTQILFNLAGKPDAEGAVSFTDVDSAAWYADAIAWASGKGVVSGYGSTFGPNDLITREQMAVMLFNYARVYEMDLTVDETVLQAFQDAGDISGWAQEAVLWAVGAGLLTGQSAGALAPTATATRAEVATILMRFCQSNEL